MKKNKLLLTLKNIKERNNCYFQISRLFVFVFFFFFYYRKSYSKLCLLLPFSSSSSLPSFLPYGPLPHLHTPLPHTMLFLNHLLSCVCVLFIKLVSLPFLSLSLTPFF